MDSALSIKIIFVLIGAIASLVGIIYATLKSRDKENSESIKELGKKVDGMKETCANTYATKEELKSDIDDVKKQQIRDYDRLEEMLKENSKTLNEIFRMMLEGRHEK